MKTLGELVEGLQYQSMGDLSKVPNEVTFDSRAVKPGALFVALRGKQVDGHSFIPKALESGAAAVLAEERAPAGVAVPWIVVGDTLKALAHVAPRFWDFPSRKLLTIGITGTNGKTTSSYLLESILEAAGIPCGVLGTINYRYHQQSRPAPNTTPFASDLQRFMADVVRLGGKSVVMEVSSHALALGRVNGVDFDAALFTNLTQDHLDFHETMDRYADSKATLFSGLDPASAKPYRRCAVINSDDPWSEAMVKNVRVPILRYGASGDYRAIDIECSANGSKFTIIEPNGKLPVQIALVGDYNVTNALGCAATALSLGIAADAVVQGLRTVQQVPGRMETVKSDRPFSVVVDYAHTEDALRKVMTSLRALRPTRLITVFGCGGDRDRTKRPLMGSAAAELSDYVFVTSDNPRSEDPAKIALDVEVGVRRVRADRYEIILDRAEAIRAAITVAQKGDIVLIAGKGHETYQIVGRNTLPFDDRDVARHVLS